MESAFRRETLAALTAIDPTPVEQVDPALLLIPLERVGDALRLGLPLPAPAGLWLSRVPVSVLGPVFDALRAEVPTWSVPGTREVAEDDPALEFAVRRRDQAESVVLAAARVCAPSRVVPGRVPGYAALRAALAEFDTRLKSVASRSTVESMLGARAGCLGPRAWTSALEEPAAAREGEPEHDEGGWSDAALRVPPSDAVVTAYALRGKRARYVEGFAASTPEFADELADVIASLEAAGEPLAIAAGGWRLRQRRQSASTPIALKVVPVLRKAAATDQDVDEAQVERELGALPPLDAVARLICTARVATLHVYAAPNALARIEFGGETVTTPQSPGHWLVSHPVSVEPTRLRVVGSGGEEFSATLKFDPTGPEAE